MHFLHFFYSKYIESAKDFVQKSNQKLLLSDFKGKTHKLDKEKGMMTWFFIDLQDYLPKISMIVTKRNSKKNWDKKRIYLIFYENCNTTICRLFFGISLHFIWWVNLYHVIRYHITHWTMKRKINAKKCLFLLLTSVIIKYIL